MTHPTEAAPRNILIIKMSSIGDVAQALPVASALRRRHPAARIAWAVEGSIASLLDRHPAVDRVIRFPPMRWPADPMSWRQRFGAALAAVREETYDVAIDLQGLLKSAVVSLASRAPRRIGIALLREGASLVSRAAPPGDERAHAVEEYLACAEALGAPGRPVVFGLRAAPEAVAGVEKLLSLTGIDSREPLIVLNPSASDERKSWPIERWSELAGKLAPLGRIVLVGTIERSKRHAAIVAGASPRPYDLTGRTTLAELIALLDRTALHVAPDTGSAHIAAALGRPVVGIYGPTPPWRLAPWGQADRVAYEPGVCGRTCPSLCMRRRRCLAAITIEEVARLARDAMAPARSVRSV